MTSRAARTITICRWIALAIMAIGIAVTIRVSWIFSAFIVFMVTIFQSRHIYVGWVPVDLPGFEDQVAGEMLSGMSEEWAVAFVSRSEAGRAIFLTVFSALICAAIALAAHGIVLPNSWVSWFLGRAALWIVGVGVAVVVLPIVLYPFYRKYVRGDRTR